MFVNIIKNQRIWTNHTTIILETLKTTEFYNIIFKVVPDYNYSVGEKCFRIFIVE